MSDNLDVIAKEKLAKEEENKLSPREKVAVMMVALGQESAADIMKFLTDYGIEEITHTIAELKHLPIDVQDEVLPDFEQHLLTGEYMSQGGVDFARGALERAVGPRKAQAAGQHAERMRSFIEEEMDFPGPMGLSEEEVQLRIVQKIRQLEDQGQVQIIRGSADTFV